MLDINEVRLHNYVMVKTLEGAGYEKRKIYAIWDTGVSTYNCRFEASNGGYVLIHETDKNKNLIDSYLQLNGVEITGQSLTFLGFKELLKDKNYALGGLSLILDRTYAQLLNGSANIGNRIQFIHQLQNSYFDLTGNFLLFSYDTAI
jgi:hypothetical protein